VPKIIEKLDDSRMFEERSYMYKTDEILNASTVLTQLVEGNNEFFKVLAKRNSV
jgi:hypothetical protein